MSALLGASILIGVGAAVFSVPPASSNSFTGSDNGSSSGGGGTCGLNMSCTDSNFIATAANGVAGYGCNSALASCVDLGPGACNGLGTDGTASIILGTNPNGTPCAPVVKFGATGNVQITGNGGILLANTALDMNNNSVLTNTAAGKPVLVNEENGFRLTGYSATPTCNSGATGTVSVDSDDSRAYYCNGSAAYTILTGIRQTTTLDYPTINNLPASASLDVTVTGAAPGDSAAVTVNCPSNATLANVAIGQPVITSANTVSVRARNLDPSSSINPDPCDVVILVVKQ